MANINLATGDVIEKHQEKERRLNSGLIAVIVISVLIAGVYIAEQVYKQHLTKKISETKNDYAAVYSALTGPKTKDVIDFRRRLEAVKKVMAQGRNVPGDMTGIEKTILPEVRLTAYSYDASKNILKLSCATDNYNSLARQVLSFKNSGYFESVNVDKTSRDEQSSEISFDVSLTFK